VFPPNTYFCEKEINMKDQGEFKLGEMGAF